MTPNQAAILATIRSTEGTALLDDPWRATFQGENPDGTKKPMHIIRDLSDHPFNTGEWKGESLAFLDKRNGGTRYAHLVSTAAGAYMIIERTWNAYKPLLHMTGFNRPWQDDVALQIIKDRGALSYVNDGKLVEACDLLNDEWASLPGSRSDQPQYSMASVIDLFRQNGGMVA